MTRDNQSPTDLELLLGELADASVLHPVELRQLLTAVRLEAEQREVLLQEASAIELDLARQKERPAISLDLLFPEPLALALRRVTEHLPYCDHVVATTYLAGISGLVKLGTSLCGKPLHRFRHPGQPLRGHRGADVPGIGVIPPAPPPRLRRGGGAGVGRPVTLVRVLPQPDEPCPRPMLPQLNWSRYWTAAVLGS